MLESGRPYLFQRFVVRPLEAFMLFDQQRASRVLLFVLDLSVGAQPSATATVNCKGCKGART